MSQAAEAGAGQLVPQPLFYPLELKLPGCKKSANGSSFFELLPVP